MKKVNITESQLLKSLANALSTAINEGVLPNPYDEYGEDSESNWTEGLSDEDKQELESLIGRITAQGEEMGVSDARIRNAINNQIRKFRYNRGL